MVTKTMQRVSPNLFLLGRKSSDLVPSAINFPTSLLLDAVGKSLKFHTNVQQGLKKLLNGFLDLSFCWVTTTYPFCSTNTSFLYWMCMEADCHKFLIHLAYQLFRFDIPSITWYIWYVNFTFWKNWYSIYKLRYAWYFARKAWSNKKIFKPDHVLMLYHKKQLFVDTRVPHSCTLKFFCFGDVSVFQIRCGTCQLFDEGISGTTNIKKILETSYGKMLNLVYQNWYTKFII